MVGGSRGFALASPEKAVLLSEPVDVRFSTLRRNLDRLCQFFDRGRSSAGFTVARHLSSAIKARIIQSVRLDGCVFSLRDIPESETKAFLCSGCYEAEERSAVPKYVKPELPVIELGGCIGVVACITDRLLIAPRIHRVVEANPGAICHLERSRKRNRCTFEIINAAIAYGAEQLTFHPSSNLWSSSMVRTGDMPSVTINAIRLAELVRDLDTFTLICDIEGAECEMVRNEAQVLRKADTIILETHSRFVGEGPNRVMMATLREIGFTVVEQYEFVAVLQKEQQPH